MASSQSVIVATMGNCNTVAKNRPLAKFHPSVWADRFISFGSCSSLTNSPYDSYSKQIQVLKEKVRDMCHRKIAQIDPVDTIILIDSLCRLGISYHFEEEIEQELRRIFNTKLNMCMSNDYDLYTTALVFRVFRQHGHKMSCEIFGKFKDGDRFKRNLSSDVRGMLSLYEASHLRVHGEDILDEALVFTTTHLTAFVKDHPGHEVLVRQVLHALQHPLHKGMPRLESRRFISFYQEDETRDETLLKFAELDFNLLQLLHQQELDQIQRWWKELNLTSKLSYARDRIVECYFWMSGVYHEPHFSRARIFLTKVVSLHSVIDDTYDAYATFEEIKLCTHAIQRWEAKAVEQLPEYMHILYNTLLNVYEEMEKDVTREGRSYSVNYAREAMKESVRAYYKEAEWLEKSYIPTFDEYMETSLISGGCHTLALTSFVGMEIAGKKEFEWIRAKPKCDIACQIIGRLSDDITGYKVEKERGHIPSAVECYMAQYSVSEEEALGELRRVVEDAWKDINEDFLSLGTDVPMHILMRVLNLSRTMDVVYKSGDGYTNAEGDTKSHITLLYVNPISINDPQ